MTDLSLNERAALAAGWTKCIEHLGCGNWNDPVDGFSSFLPDFDHSLDACLTWIWPLVQAKGGVGFWWDGKGITIESLHREQIFRRAAIPAEAFTLACLEVLEEKP